jgi:hypothetical protein
MTKVKGVDKVQSTSKTSWVRTRDGRFYVLSRFGDEDASLTRLKVEALDFDASDSGVCFIRKDRKIVCVDLDSDTPGFGPAKKTSNDRWRRSDALPEKIFSFGQVIEGVERTKALSTGALQSCALSLEGKVSCWGVWNLKRYESPFQLRHIRFPGAERVDQISVSGTHSCALQGGEVYCWGDNRAYELGGELQASNSEIPVRLPFRPGVVEVLATPGRTCARFTDGAVECVGGTEALYVPEKILDRTEKFFWDR